MGLLGGVLGFVAGMGFILIFVLTYGTNSIGVTVDLRAAALDAMQPALLPGLLGLMAAPAICALAAWLPIRRVLRQPPVDILAARST